MMLDIPNFDITLFFSVIAAITTIFTLYHLFILDKSDNKFSIVDLIADSNGASLSKIASLTALIVSTWAFAFLTIAGKLSPEFYAIYMVTWSGSRVLSKWLDLKFSNKNYQE